MDIQHDSTSDAMGVDGMSGELKSDTKSQGLQNPDLGGVGKSSDVPETLARYVSIVRVFTEWYETQYGDGFTPDVFINEEVMGRYLQHCSARFSQSSVRRIRTALQTVAAEAAHARVVATLAAALHE